MLSGLGAVFLVRHITTHSAAQGPGAKTAILTRAYTGADPAPKPTHKPPHRHTHSDAQQSLTHFE